MTRGSIKNSVKYFFTSGVVGLSGVPNCTKRIPFLPLLLIAYKATQKRMHSGSKPRNYEISVTGNCAYNASKLAFTSFINHIGVEVAPQIPMRSFSAKTDASNSAGSEIK
ncbi:hypothetical protein D3C71_1384790 [compost metagenome]